jgi:hypothetical protein
MQDKSVLSGKIPRLLDEPITDSNLHSSVSDVDYVQEVLIQAFLQGVFKYCFGAEL